MNKYIYLISHGAVISDPDNKDTVKADKQLSPWGMKETMLLRKWYDSGHTYPIYTSPLAQCRKTAENIGGYGTKKSLISFVKEDTMMPIIEMNSLKISGAAFKTAINQIAVTEESSAIIIADIDAIKTFLSDILRLPFAKIPYPFLGITILRVDSNGYTLESEWHDYRKENNWIMSKHGLGIVVNGDLYHKIGQKPVEMLRQDELSHFYSMCNTSDHAIAQMELVSSYIDSLLSLLDVDLECKEAEFIRAASLTYRMCSDGNDTSMSSADHLRNAGFFDVANLAEEVSNTEIGVMPFLSLKELLFYADKRVLNNQLVNIEEYFKATFPSDKTLYRKTKLIEIKIEKHY